VVCRTLFYLREIRHSAHARLDHSRPAATPHSLRRPGCESLCLPAPRSTQAESGLAIEAGQARPAPTRVLLRLGGQDRGLGLGIRQPASTRAGSGRESGSRRKLSPDRRAQSVTAGSLVGLSDPWSLLGSWVAAVRPTRSRRIEQAKGTEWLSRAPDQLLRHREPLTRIDTVAAPGSAHAG